MGQEMKTEFCIDTAEGVMESCPAVFDIDHDSTPAEPYSWGQSRGVEHEVEATLREFRIGRWVGDRDAAIAMTGMQHVRAQEKHAAQLWFEQMMENV